jgi:hypothetical protein
VTPDFAAQWEAMARTSFHHYRRYLGLPGDPVEWLDQYYVLGNVPGAAADVTPADTARIGGGELSFAGYLGRIRDITPHSEAMAGADSPFAVANVRRSQTLTFNVANYGHTLFNDFLLAGGKVERREFHTPADLAHLKERVIINCPGYGARALWKDESVVPVRGQIAWLIPQAEAHYAVYYRHVGVVARRDGIVVQSLQGGDMRGYGIDDETPDRTEAEHAVATVRELDAAIGKVALAAGGHLAALRG